MKLLQLTMMALACVCFAGLPGGAVVCVQEPRRARGRAPVPASDGAGVFRPLRALFVWCVVCCLLRCIHAFVLRPGATALRRRCKRCEWTTSCTGTAPVPPRSKARLARRGPGSRGALAAASRPRTRTRTRSSSSRRQRAVRSRRKRAGSTNRVGRQGMFCIAHIRFDHEYMYC